MGKQNININIYKNLENPIKSTFSTNRYKSPNTLISYFRVNRHLIVDIPKNSMEYSKILVKYLVDLKTQ